ncbi:hypothetical protein ScalyP_jg7415 [Parmales sp. scaly parma]|nr:hypothetical protein ScalyP_jg7415 [Parmales sp. scaly parma]
MHKTAANSIHNEYLTLTPLQTLIPHAAAATQRFKSQSPLSALDGIPISIKSNLSLKSSPTTANSSILDSYSPPFDATVVSRLKSSGAIILGSTNMDEFAYLKIDNSTHPPTFYLPGGSSSGSAASVANKTSVVSLGTDTGGSVRTPAAICGLVGFKPSYGSVSRHGLIAYASSLDTVGVIGNCVSDVKIVFDVIKGTDDNDMTTQLPPSPPSHPQTIKTIDKLRIGIPEVYNILETPQLITSTWLKVIDSLPTKMSTKIPATPASTQIIQASLPAYYVIACAEASSNLSRYDGVRYGAKNENETNSTKSSFKQSIAKLRSAHFGPEVVKRILCGTAVLSRGGSIPGGGYYNAATKVRSNVTKLFDDWLTDVDVLIYPTSTTTEFIHNNDDNNKKSEIEELGQDIFTVGVNLAGLAAISIPIPSPLDPHTKVGIQIVGKCNDTVLSVAQLIEELH